MTDSELLSSQEADHAWKAWLEVLYQGEKAPLLLVSGSDRSKWLNRALNDVEQAGHQAFVIPCPVVSEEPLAPLMNMVRILADVPTVADSEVWKSCAPHFAAWLPEKGIEPAPALASLRLQWSKARGALAHLLNTAVEGACWLFVFDNWHRCDSESRAWVHFLLERCNGIGFIAASPTTETHLPPAPVTRLVFDDSADRTAKLEGLSDRAKPFAYRAAVLGYRFPTEHLQAPDTVLEELNAAAVIAGPEQGVLEFLDHGLADHLYASMSEEERRRSHAAIAQHLCDQTGETQVMTWIEHTIHAGEPEPIAQFALQAAREALRTHQRLLAHRYFRIGLSNARQLGNEVATVDYLQALGDLERRLGHTRAAGLRYREALSLTEAPERSATLNRSLAHVEAALGNEGEAQRLAERALSQAEHVVQTEERIRCLLMLVWIHNNAGRPNAALPYAERAHALALEADHPALLGEAQAYLGQLYMSYPYDRVQQGIGLLRGAQALLTGQDNQDSLYNTYLLLGNAHSLLGDFTTSAAAYQRAAELGRDETRQAYATYYLAEVALEQGDLTRALTLAEQAIALGHPIVCAQAHVIAAAAQLYRGLYEEGAHLFTMVPRPEIRAVLYLHQIEAALFLGQIPLARQAGDALGRLMDESGDRELEGRLEIALAELAVRQGHNEEASLRLDRAEAAARKALARGLLARAGKVSALRAYFQENDDVAIAVAEEALLAARDVGARILAAELLYVLGRSERRLGLPSACQRFSDMSLMAEAIASDFLQAQALHEWAESAPEAPESPQRRGLGQQLASNWLAFHLSGYPERHWTFMSTSPLS